VTPPGGGGFRVIAGLVASRVEHHRVDALDVNELGQRFDLHASDTLPKAGVRSPAAITAPMDDEHY
jgi:hypothetical protein